ncbi:stress responsive a b barrel domain containing protein [Grosmannia clavigera kw1407]|uniref:Stress responsive a b barrel domain containing protein n=1 Tax=Grosmannia clavigera (strain kw1407 / UAMH 11150) TaxID=655863 RepID=F0XJQ0_GROCL|nr:stress responsive a b barrel domain containing protein [Grosmannia clavigera kw1407]EFX02140.1 stress responsive a b barrel domain containing protein [Grosmannia clavigera kw1407]
MLTFELLARTKAAVSQKQFYSNTTSMSKPIQRLTLFKIADMANQKKLLEYYKALPTKADGKPYIKSIMAGLTKEDQRNQGYTVAANTTFASIEDMAYYDNNCAAHAEVKDFARPVTQDILMVYFENEML